MAQIGGNLRPGELAEFKQYASNLLISESSLANLLIQREVWLRRLGHLMKRFAGPVPASERGGRITGHQANGELKEALKRHAKEQGTNLSHAATILFRAELDERWLAKCVGDWRAESY